MFSLARIPYNVNNAILTLPPPRCGVGGQASPPREGEPPLPAPVSKTRPRPQRRAVLDRGRAFTLLIFVMLVVGLLIVRLVDLQIIKGPGLRRDAIAQRRLEIDLPAPRGRILDRNGLVLVGNVTRHTLIAIPSQMKDPPKVAAALSPVLGQPADDILVRFKESPYYVVVAHKLTDDKVAAVEKLKLTGLRLEPDPIRYYPQSGLAAPILGVVGDEHRGLEGLELYYDDVLRGRPGVLEAEFDPGRLEAISVSIGRKTEPEPGHDLVLTIDSVIQQAVDDELDRLQRDAAPKRSLVMVMDVSNGEVLAMAQRPDFDPTRWREFDVAQRRNWAVTDVVAPGSVFKPLTAAAALDSGAVGINEEFYDGGSYKVPGHTITNWDGSGFGYGTIADAIRTSSNVGFAQIGLKLGVDRFYEYLGRFNLVGPTGIDFPGEAAAILPRQESAKPLDLANMAFGQTLGVTPVQLLAALGTVANDGVLVRPHFVREERTADGHLVKVTPAVQMQRVGAETARSVRQMMETVVTRGTGQAAAIPGFAVAGKTGTAQIFEKGRLLDNFLVDFVGMVPAAKPKIMILIMIDQPGKGEALGGKVAAPVFHNLAPGILRHLGILAPTDILASTPAAPKAVKVPKLVGESAGKAFAAARAAGLYLTVSGSGPNVTAQEPAAGAELLPGARITARADGAMGATADSVYVPDLLRSTVRQAADALAGIGLKAETEGAGVVTRQEPRPGSLVPRSTPVHLWLGS